MDSKLMFSGLAALDCQGFKHLLDSQSLVDCTLACDGGRVSAHKMVLSACSSYLAKILLDHPVEHPIIILPELNIDDVKTLIHYMYTGELLKSDTVNSISLLRTAAILSINSLNDLLLSSASSFASPTPNNSSQTLTANNLNDSTGQMHHQQQHMPIVDRISPLLTSLSQQHQQRMCNYHQSLNTNQVNSLSLGQNSENINRKAVDENDGLSLATTSSSFTSIIAAAAIAASTVNESSSIGDGTNLDATQYCHSLIRGPHANRLVSAPNTASSLNSLSSASSSSSPPMNNSSSKLSSGSGSLKLEPFAYSSALIGMTSVSNNEGKSGSTNQSTGSQSNAFVTNEFQFKCPVCQNHFQTICSFEYHMQRVHSVTSFGCEICHKPFASLRYVLTDHMRRCHGWKSAATNSSASSGNNI